MTIDEEWAMSHMSHGSCGTPCRSFADRRLISDRAVAMAAILGAWGSHGDVAGDLEGLHEDHLAVVAVVVEGRVDSAALRHQPGPQCHTYRAT